MLYMVLPMSINQQQPSLFTVNRYQGHTIAAIQSLGALPIYGYPYNKDVRIRTTRRPEQNLSPCALPLLLHTVIVVAVGSADRR